MAKYTNKWVFADLVTDISEQVWLIGKKYLDRADASKAKNMNKYAAGLTKYWWFTYLTGSRLMEGMKEPLPTVAFIRARDRNGQERTVVEIHKLNEKHRAPDGGVEVIPQVLPIFNVYEYKMWNAITEGGLNLTPDKMFNLDRWRARSEQAMSGLIKSNFRTTLRDEKGYAHEDYGITPHILRHMRAFHVVAIQGLPIPLAISYFGWRDQRMLFYYAHLRDRMLTNNQLGLLKGIDLGAIDFTVDAGKAIPGY